MLTLALSWLCVAGYKDDVDNAKELFKSAIVDEATRLFKPLKPNATPNAPPGVPPNNDVDVQVCDDDDVFGMVNVGWLGQDIESGANVVLDTTMSGDLVNKAFKEWILLKVD
jgi:hypothetical protein